METVQKKKRRRLRRLKLTKKDKKLAVRILMAFVAIVCGLTSSSYYLNFKKEKQEIADRAASLGLTRNIVQTEDEDILSVNYGKDSYTKIGENVYIVNYDSYDEAKKAGSDSGKRTEGVMSEMDTLFVTAFDSTVPADGESSNSNGHQMADSASEDDVVPLDASDLDGILEEANPEDMIVDEEVDESKYEVASLPEGYTAKQFAEEQGNQLVAVIDTGADVGVVSSVNFTDEEDGDENGHGTTIVKKILDSADGKATIVSLKAINKNGKGLMTDVYKAVRWAIDNDVDVINMSICAYDDGNQTIFKSLIQEALDKGITVVASAGNYNSDVKNYLPANIKGVISVGTRNGILKGSSSNYGDVTYFEEENSTSEATAKITGMIASGKDLSNEKTKDDIRYDETEVNEDPVNNSDMDFKVQVNARHNVNYNLNGGAYSVAHKEGENWIFPNGEYAFRSYYSDYVASGTCTPGTAGSIYVTQDMINRLNQPVYLHAEGEDSNYMVTYRGYGNGNSTWRLERYKNTEWYFIINTSSGKLLYDTSGNAGGYLKIGSQTLDGRFIWRFKEITTGSGKKAVKIVNNATGQTPTVQYVEYFQTYQNSGNGLRIKAFSQNDGDDGAWTVVKVSDRDSRVKQYGYPFYTESSYINPPKPGYTFGGWCTSPSNYLDNNFVRKTSSSSHIKSYRITQITSQEGGVRFQILAKGDSAVSAISVAMWAMNGGTTTSAQDTIKWAYLGRGSWNGEDGAGTYNFGCEVEYNPSAKDSFNGLVCFDFYYNDNAYAACGATYFAPVYGTEFNYTFDREGKDATVYAMWQRDVDANKDASTQYALSPNPVLTEDLQYDSKKTETEYKIYDLGDTSKWGIYGISAVTLSENGTKNKMDVEGVPSIFEKAYIPIATTVGQTYYYNFNYDLTTKNTADANKGYFRVLNSKPGNKSYDTNNGNIIASTTLQTGTAKNCQGSFKATSDITYICFDFSAMTDSKTSFIGDNSGGTATLNFDDILITTKPNPHTLSNPTRAGYELTKWTENADGTGTAYKAGDKVNLTKADTTYYAQWKPLITESPLNVNLGTWNGSSYTYTKNANGMYNNKEADSQKGYKVATVDYKAIFDGSSDYSTKTGISENKTKVLIDSTVSISNLTMMNGYKFEAWEGSGATSNTNTSFKVTPPDSSGKSTNETTLKARGVSYNVVFHNNSVKGVNGTPNDDQTVLANGSMATQTMHYGAKETLAKNQFSWEGHTFLGWSTIENGTSVSSYNGITFTDGASGFFDGMGKLVNVHDDGATVHLYAVWSTEKTTVTIDPTHGTYAGTANKTTKTQKWGSTLSVPNATANNVSSVLTYNFNADGVTWSGTQPAGVSSSALNSKTDTSRLEFSNWVIKDKATGIEVSENNGSWGYLRDPNTYVFGAFDAIIEGRYYFSRVILPVPERTNYTFAGWYYDADCTQFAGNGGSEYRADDTENSKRYTLYARWEKNTYNYTDTMDYNIVDETIQENHDYPEFKIRKTDELGNVLTTVRTASGETKSFVIEITSGTTYNHNNLVYTLDTGKGILDKSGNVVISNSSSKYNKDAGWYDMTDMLPKGKYTAHEVSAPAGWYMDADQTFEVTGSKADYENAIAELNSAKKNLDEVTIQNDAQALKKAQERFEKAEANVNYLKSGYNHVTFKDKEITINEDVPKYVAWKHDSQGRPIANATFNLIDNTDGNKVIKSFVTNRKGNLPSTIAGYLVAGHKMTLEEANVPEGYQKVSTTFTVPTEPQEDLSFINDIEEPSNTAELKVKKTDKDGTVLQGAGFKLFVKTTDGDIVEARYNKTTGEFIQPGTADYDSDKAVAYEGETGADGTVSFKKLPTRATFDGQSEVGTKKYYIQETKAPAGYKLNASFVEVLLEDQNNTVQTFTITDAKATLDVLQTGGSGSSPYIFAGVLLIVLGITLSSLKKQHFIK